MTRNETPLDEPDEAALISIFWNQLRIADEIGAAQWEVLEGLERKVTDCLAASPQMLEEARAYTAQAMLLVSGDTY